MRASGAISAALRDWGRRVAGRFGDEHARRRAYYERKLDVVPDKTSATSVFETIYRENLWNSGESRSGPGSELGYTAPLRKSLEDWMQRHRDEVGTFLDAPCGDFNWMQHVRLPDGWTYHGADIVAPLIAENTRRFGGEQRRFSVLDIAAGDLPNADAWLCRDVLFHLPYQMGVRVVERFRASKARYFLSTTFPDVTANAHDIAIGHYRDINLALAPYGLGEPVDLLPDDPDPVPRRFVGVWRNPKL